QVQYVGRLPDGSVFDQSTQAQWFRLNSVIEGWRTVLPQMPVGAKWRVVIASGHAYGADGAGALIPPNTPLTFDIHLLATAP
ncbi:MAG: FKBP-type peptidyl-prolyl cis-trans isomerase, partial [Proteobacteria bacterium]